MHRDLVIMSSDDDQIKIKTHKSSIIMHIMHLLFGSCETVKIMVISCSQLY